ncbi:efflux RND transporter periplasmic adaptor subunit [Shewanella gelidii]|uniref:Multidrug transporter n=1 Tax=Shewanella gelidii TaxID=1642821 RepID=A0A917NBQ3_9GAMM|nr:efflux RND transporter periplasmic adaptor subunit [Shewanella gelidii]MCL1099129.1 efflux RND transporter periplasmic adaptor subunit [Shewanella gelidii]GGI81501.1 multidrug transporter [Shewanella gelidii]
MQHLIKLVSVVMVIMGLAACEQEQKQAQQQQMPPAEVSVLTVATKSQAIQVELPGRSSAYLEAEVRPQVSGIVTERSFIEGKDVVKGESLYQIDPSTYEAALVSAKADLGRAEAAAATAKGRAERFKALVKKNAISEQDYDDAVAAYKEAQASVIVAKAAINTAEINLKYTEVLAPISGRVGKSNVTAGALVTASQSQTLATIQQLDPINVDIVQSSAQLLRLKAKLRDGELTKSTNGDVTLLLEDGSTYAHIGQLKFAEVRVDENTGSVTIRAEFPNPDGVLLPGMFVRALLDTGTDPKAILVPQRAVTRNTKGQAVVMLVNGEDKVESRIITTAEVIDNKWRVIQGLSTGERVIVEGLQKIRPGAPVVAKPFVSTKPQA